MARLAKLGWSAASRCRPWGMTRRGMRRDAPANCRVKEARRAFSAQDGVELADRCHQHIIASPFPPISKGPYPPLYEFLTSQWKSHGGHLDDKVSIVDGTTGLQRTFREHHALTAALAATFYHDMNIQTEADTVAMYCPNHVDYLPVILAVSLCGAKVTPVNPLYTRSELDVVLERSRAAVLVAHESKREVALAAAAQSPHVRQVIFVTDGDRGAPLVEGTVHLDAIRQSGHAQAFTDTHYAVHPATHSHSLILPYSSGTTGLPKGVCLTHENIVANLLQCEQIEGPSFSQDHKLISPLPFFHIYAFTVSMLYTAWKGQTVITNSGRFDLESFCRLVEEHRPQRAHLVPPILLGLAKSPLVDQYDLSSLEMIVSAAAPLGSDVEEAVQKRLGCGVKQAWGMSELSPIGTFNTDTDIRSGSVGPLVSSTFAKVVDETGQSLPAFEDGELLIQGPQVMKGYLEDPEKTAECLSESRWLRTGDVAHYDKDGYIYITDRIKELIKVNGFPVAPAELEALLLTHPAVADVAVIGIPDDKSQEAPRAYIVITEGVIIGAEDIYAWVSKRVVHYKRLQGGIVFCEAIPKSASGKILRRILRDELEHAVLEEKRQGTS